jgi:hypothetical protein
MELPSMAHGSAAGELDENVVTHKPLEFSMGKNSDYNFV